MNTHKNARLTFARRIELVTDIVERKITPCAAAAAHGVTAATARKWLGRYLAADEAGLADRSSRPHRSPRSMPAATALAIVELRHRRLTHARIAASLGVSKSSVGRVPARAGLSRLSDLQPVEPVQRYEHAAPGDLLHIDTKKLGRIERPSHRVTGNRRDTVKSAGWEFLFVAIDDHARIGFTDMYPDERGPSAEQFLRNAHAYYASLGVRLKAVLTDNGSAFRSHAFRQACAELGLKQRFTHAYRPQTNGKAERFIQSALREWAYAFSYQHSIERTETLEAWMHHYNWHRPHQGIGGLTPMSRLRTSRNNLLTLHRPELAKNISPTGWMVMRGMKFTSHHDAPVAFPDSMRVLDATVTRKARGSGKIIGPDQRVDVITALKAMTIWPAWQHYEEKTKGSIEVGKLADFVILSRDPTKGDVNTIDMIKVTETIKEGGTVFKLTAEEQRKAALMLKPDGRGDTAFSRFARGASSHAHVDEAHADSCMSPVLLQMVAAIAGMADDK